MRRRQIGPAYERSPADKMGEWTNRNTLVLISSIAAAVGVWFAVNWIVDGLMNFLARGSDETMANQFNSNDPVFICVKLVLCLATIFIILKSRTK